MKRVDREGAISFLQKRTFFMQKSTALKMHMGVEAYQAHRSEMTHVRNSMWLSGLGRLTTCHPYYIYALRDPTLVDPYGHPSGPIFYVGQSINPKTRYDQHSQTIACKNGQTAKAKYVEALHNQGKAPVMELLNRVKDTAESLKVERLWMYYCMSLGYVLTNSGLGKPRAKFAHSLALDGQAGQMNLGQVAAAGFSLMLQCLSCGNVKWRNADQLISCGLQPTITINQYRTFQHICAHCGSGAITTGVDETGDML
jgi:hypothetical protein